MNEQEAIAFSEELIIAFPAFRAHAEKHSPDFDRTRRAWSFAWSDLAISECRDALRKLLVDGGISYENLQQPGPFIRRLVLEARKEGRQSEADLAIGVDRDKALARRRDYKGSPMAAALAKAIEMRQSGASFDRVYAMIDSSFPPAAAYDSETYRCLLCRDRGLVQVVRVDTIARVQRLELEASSVHYGMTYNVACTCSVGRLVQQRNPMNQSGQLPVFSPQNFCCWHDDGLDADRINKWIANHKPSNFDNSFDTWNQQSIALS